MAGLHVRIESARAEHLPAIVSIADRCALGETPEDAMAERGFLISGYEESEYEAFLDDADHFRVATVEGGVGAFLLACSSDRLAGEEWLHEQIARRRLEPYVLIKQIAVDPAHAGRGLASALYRDLFARVPELPCSAAVVLEPLNRRSQLFHVKHLFELAFEATPADGMARGVYRRPPGGPSTKD